MQRNNPKPPPPPPPAPIQPSSCLSICLHAPRAPAHPLLQTFQFNHIYAGGGLCTRTKETQMRLSSLPKLMFMYQGSHVATAVIENEKCPLSRLKLIQRKARLISTMWRKEQFYPFVSTLFLVEDSSRGETPNAPLTAPLLRWRSGNLNSDCVKGSFRVMSEARDWTTAMALHTDRH